MKEYKTPIEALRELHAIVKGECPSLLDEDSGGDSALDIAIDGFIAEEQAQKPVADASLDGTGNKGLREEVLIGLRCPLDSQISSEPCKECNQPINKYLWDFRTGGCWINPDYTVESLALLANRKGYFINKIYGYTYPVGWLIHIQKKGEERNTLIEFPKNRDNSQAYENIEDEAREYLNSLPDKGGKVNENT